MQTGALELVAADFVEARVRYVEQRVDVGDQRMAAVFDAVAIDAPALLRQPAAALAQEQGVSVRCLLTKDGGVPDSDDAPGTLAIVARAY